MQITAIEDRKALSFMVILPLVICLLILAFAFQGSRGIFAPDEGNHVSIAKAMLDTGDLLIPRVHQEIWLDKPPLSFWGIAAGMYMFGDNEWGARVFNGLCFMLTALLVFFLGKSLGGNRQGLLGAIIYSTMIIPFAAGNVLTPDTPLTFWVTAAFFCFWKSIEPGTRREVLWKMLMCAAFGLGFLTKGPAVLIFAGAIFVFIVLQRRVLRYFLTPWALVGLGIFCVLGLGWYAYVTREVHGSLAYFWDNQVFGRTISDKYNRNAGWTGALIYLPVVLLGTLPWSLVCWRELMDRGRKILRKSYWINLRNRPADLLPAVWIVFPLLIFCAASSRLPLYVLPVFPAFALSLASLWPAPSSGKIWHSNPLGFSRGESIALVLWVVILLGVKHTAAHYPHRQNMRALYASIVDKLPNEAYEIVCVDEHLEGLGFYDNSLVERVTTSVIPYPLFMVPEQLNEEFEEIRTSKYAHVLLCRKEERANLVRSTLTNANILFEESVLPFRHFLFVCHPAPEYEDNYRVRLIALGDSGKGKGKSRQFSISSALNLLYAEKTFESGILLLGDNLDCNSDDAANVEDASRRSFEKPFADLLTEGVPFYAVLGNHDNNPLIREFELKYPLFHMEGHRYYSKLFGDGLMETFMLDSNTLYSKESEPEQIAWLERSLAESKAAWKVVVLHNPVYTTAKRHPSDPHMIEKLEPIFRKYGVSIVLQGHNHLYERLSPIQGITYITAGSGGTINENDLRPNAPERMAGNDQTEVFLMLEFDERTCHLMAYDSLGSVVDETMMSNPIEL